MKKKKEILKAQVEEGVYECPSCGDVVYLDTWELSKLNESGRLQHVCPSCNNKIKLYGYEPDNYSEL